MFLEKEISSRRRAKKKERASWCGSNGSANWIHKAFMTEYTTLLFSTTKCVKGTRDGQWKMLYNHERYSKKNNESWKTGNEWAWRPDSNITCHINELLVISMQKNCLIIIFNYAFSILLTLWSLSRIIIR